MKLIARGRKSEIYDLGPPAGGGKVMKLYEMGFPKKAVEREFRNTKVVHEGTELSIPKPYEIVTKRGRYGIVFEKIEGISYMDIFQKMPWWYFTEAGKLAEIHRKIHRFEVKGLQSQYESFEKLIKNSLRLSENEKVLLVSILKRTNRPMLCHGDFHHGNLMITPLGGVFIFDWMDAFIGDPILDIALTAVNAAVSDAPVHVPWVYRQLYTWVKHWTAVDKLVLKQHKGINRQKLTEALVLAAGIHLARKEGSGFAGHRKYFELAMKRL